VNAEPGQPGSQSPQVFAVASLCRLPTRFTEVGSGVWSAKAGVGEMTPEIRMIMLKQLIKRRLNANLFAFIHNSPLSQFVI